MKGFLAAGVAGFLGGVSAAFLKLGGIPMIVLGGAIQALSFGAKLYALSKARVVIVAPILGAISLLTSVFAGLLFFGETLTAAQWGGVLLLTAGSSLLSGKR